MTNPAAQETDLDASIAAEIAKLEEVTEDVALEAATEAAAEVELEAEQTTNDIEAAPATAQENIEETDEPDAVQKRINKITADRHAETRRADALQAKLDAVNASSAEPLGDAPQLENYDYDDAKYQEALIDYKINKRDQAASKRYRETQAQNEQEAIAADFTQKAEVYAQTAPDYFETLNNIPLLPNETLNTLMQMDNGPQMAHYLGKHADVASQIASLPPMQAAMRLGEIRMTLANKTKSIKPSAAPAPVTTLTSGSSQVKDIGAMTMAEIMAMD